MRKILPVLCVAACLVFSGCIEDGQPSGQGQTYLVVVAQTDSGEFSAKLPDGRVFSNILVCNKDMHSTTAQAAEDGYKVEFQFDDNISQQSVDAQDSTYLSGQFANYYLSTGPLAYGAYVSGCVSRNTDLKYSIRLNRISPSAQVFDLHLAKYRVAGKSCFGAYESVYKGINWCTCLPVSYDQVKDVIYKVAVAAGISATTAALVATVATPVAIGALAL